jgi:hypothetical protein
MVKTRKNILVVVQKNGISFLAFVTVVVVPGATGGVVDGGI